MSLREAQEPGERAVTVNLGGEGMLVRLKSRAGRNEAVDTDRHERGQHENFCGQIHGGLGVGVINSRDLVKTSWAVQ